MRGKICVRTPQNCNCEWTLTSSNVTWTCNELLRVEYRLNMNLINMSRLEDWPITNLYRKLAWVRPNTTDPAIPAHHYPQPTTRLTTTPFSLFSNPIRFLERDDAVGHYKRTREGASHSFSPVWNKLQTENVQEIVDGEDHSKEDINDPSS